MLTRIDDLWLASYLIAEGARLQSVSVIPYRNGRLTAVFELDQVPEKSMQTYTSGEPRVMLHALRSAMNDLRDAMHRELSRNHCQTKQMPNGQRSDGDKRRNGNENRAANDR
jgi:hypothetical protein